MRLLIGCERPIISAQCSFDRGARCLTYSRIPAGWSLGRLVQLAHRPHARRFPMCWRLAVFLPVSFATLLPTESLAQRVVPQVPKEICVPPGYKLLFKVEATGVQIYKAIEDKSAKLEWVLEAPLAELFEDESGKAGWHYEGPSWEAADGSTVGRETAEKV